MNNLQGDLFAPRWSPDVYNRAVSALSNEPDYLDPFLQANEVLLEEAGDNRLRFEEDTWDWTLRSAVGLDVEVYPNFFVACFKRFIDGKRIAFELSDRCPLNVENMLKILRNNTIITFNGRTYDLPIITLAINGASVADLKKKSDEIINTNIRHWQVEKIVGCPPLNINHVDLMEPNPSVRTGLKILTGRLHGRYLVDLPIAPSKALTHHEMNLITLYCFNDIDSTELIYSKLREPLLMRVELRKRYGIDFRSMSDSQIGEAIVRRRVEELVGNKLSKPELPETQSFSYKVPDFIVFVQKELHQLIEDLKTAVFVAQAYGRIIEPECLKDRKVKVGYRKDAMTYSVGIGGLHSTEAHRALVSDDKHVLIDVDVNSQYPNIIRRLGLYPKALGETFCSVYSEIIDERLAAKRRVAEIDAEIAELEKQLGEMER